MNDLGLPQPSGAFSRVERYFQRVVIPTALPMRPLSCGRAKKQRGRAEKKTSIHGELRHTFSLLIRSRHPSANLNPSVSVVFTP